MDNNNFLVRVRCITFNHSPYIEDTMNGFCIQETTFPFVCTIMDDASTDGEPEIIRKYLHEHFDLNNKDVMCHEETDDYVMIFAQHKTNKNCFFAVYFLKYNHYGTAELRKRKEQYVRFESVKYIALCEGDDYWIHPQKLQMEVEVLQKELDVTMVYTNFETVDENGKTISRPQYDRYRNLSKSGDILPILIKTNFPMTLTVMVRKIVYESQIYKEAPATLDYLLFVSSAFLGNAVYLGIITAAYRNAPNSMMNTQIDKVKLLYGKINRHVAIYYAKGYVKPEGMVNDVIIKYRILNNIFRSKQTLKKVFISSPSFFLIFLWIVFEKGIKLIFCR